MLLLLFELSNKGDELVVFDDEVEERAAGELDNDEEALDELSDEIEEDFGKVEIWAEFKIEALLLVAPFKGIRIVVGDVLLWFKLVLVIIGVRFKVSLERLGLLDELLLNEMLFVVVSPPLKDVA